MSTLLDLIKSQLTPEKIQSLSSSIGATPEQTKSAVSEALPMLVSALSSKANTNTGLTFLTALLDKNKDGSVIDDLLGMVTGGNSSAMGQVALQTILGNQSSGVENHVAQTSGLDSSTVAKLMPMLAPLIIGALAKTQSSQNLEAGGLASFLEKEGTSAATQTSSAGQGLLGALLDKNNDGSVMDDVLKMGMNFLK